MLQPKFPIIKEIRGLGLMIGADFGDFKIVSQIINYCLAHGLVIIPTGANGTVVRFIPPLIIKKSQINQALKIFEQALKKDRKSVV